MSAASAKLEKIGDEINAAFDAAIEAVLDELERQGFPPRTAFAAVELYRQHGGVFASESYTATRERVARIIAAREEVRRGVATQG